MPWNSRSCPYLDCFRRGLSTSCPSCSSPNITSHGISIYTYLNMCWVRYHHDEASQCSARERWNNYHATQTYLITSIDPALLMQRSDYMILSNPALALLYTEYAQLSIVMGGWYSSETALWCMINSRSWLRHFVVCAYILQLYLLRSPTPNLDVCA